MKQNDMIFICFGKDGSILGRRPFGNGTIAIQRLQFSSSKGIAFTINAQRVPQAVIYHETENKGYPISQSDKESA